MTNLRQVSNDMVFSQTFYDESSQPCLYGTLSKNQCETTVAAMFAPPGAQTDVKMHESLHHIHWENGCIF